MKTARYVPSWKQPASRLVQVEFALGTAVVELRQRRWAAIVSGHLRNLEGAWVGG